MVKLRRVTQIIFFALFIYLFFQARYPYEAGIDSDILLRFSPLLPLMDFIQNLSISSLFLPGIIILILTPFLGRFFCGWICPLGTTIDAGSKILRSPSNQKSSKFNRLVYLKYSVLIFSIILAFFSVNLWSFLDPLAIMNRTFTVFVYPVVTYATERTLLFFTDFALLEDIFYWLYDIFKSLVMPEDQFFVQQGLWIASFFIIIIGLEKLSRRFWCRYICPAGALLGILSQFRFYERIVGKECPACDKCQTQCRMNAIPEEDIAYTDKTACIECFSCGSLCPPNKKSITYRWNWQPYHSSVDYDRRRFITTSAASLTALGLISIGFRDRTQTSKLIRPPGSVPEELFLERCIRCHACLRICSSNGACLQPDAVHNTILELWAPLAIMREGYCEYNCNLCGQVCPTEAILPIDLETKQKMPMGLAYFDKNICIPYAEHKDCIVCQEHCPTPEKAIKFEVKEVLLPDDTARKVKYPYVVRELCIGCGICETKCPLTGIPGIFVTTDNQIRPNQISQL
jgi:polyferredoxin